MKKISLVKIAFLACMGVDAQVIKVMKDGAMVSQFNTETVDKVVFDKNPVIEPVDLGLSVMWAPCNIGALNPWDFGDYFAWGETEVKTEYTEAGYSLDLGQITDDTVLKLEYDVAHVKWGGKWRMPTREEFLELLYPEGDFVSSKKVTMYGAHGFVDGRLFQSTNGNSIFLPYAGSKTEAGDNNVGTHGCYWSRSLNSENNEPCYLQFYDSGVAIGPVHPYYGISVRPVWDPNMTE